MINYWNLKEAPCKYCGACLHNWRERGNQSRAMHLCTEMIPFMVFGDLEAEKNRADDAQNRYTAAERKIDDLLALLREIQWKGEKECSKSRCPSCYAYDEHDEDCRLAAALREGWL